MIRERYRCRVSARKRERGGEGKDTRIVVLSLPFSLYSLQSILGEILRRPPPPTPPLLLSLFLSLSLFSHDTLLRNKSREWDVSEAKGMSVLTRRSYSPVLARTVLLARGAALKERCPPRQKSRVVCKEVDAGVYIKVDLNKTFMACQVENSLSIHLHGVNAMGAMALLRKCNSSFPCEDYNTHRANPWSHFPLRRTHPGPGLYTWVTVERGRFALAKTLCSGATGSADTRFAPMGGKLSELNRGLRFLLDCRSGSLLNTQGLRAQAATAPNPRRACQRLKANVEPLST